MVADGYKNSEIGVIPIEWDVVKVGEILNVQTGKMNAQDQVDDGKYPFFTRSIEVQSIDTFAYDTEALFIAGEGNFKVKYYNGKFNCHQRTYMLTAINDNNMKFLLNAIQPKVNKLISTSVGSTVQSLRKPIIEALKIPLPPLKEQEKIADILSTADEKIDAITSQIQKAQTLKIGLLQKLLSEGIGHSEFKDSELGKIPKSWEVVELDDIATLNKQKYTPIQSESINYIGLEHINQEQGTINGVGSSNDTLSQKNCFNVGEILFGKLRPYLRKFYLAEIDGVCSTEILVIKAKNNILNSILFQIVKTEAFIEHSVSKVFGTKMPRTSWAILQEFKLALPPLKEQKQIAEILSTADEKLEVLRAKKEKYETLKKGLLQKLLSGEVRV